jgi:hypothetical protein
MKHENLNPPSAKRVAHRAMILAALVCRGFIESENPSEVEELRASLLPWIDKMGARDEMEKHELVALTAPLKGLEDQVQINLVWSVEALAMLSWAMGRYELHPDDEVADPQSITNTLMFLSDMAKSLVDEPSLKAKEVLKEMHDSIYTTQCQLKEFAKNPLNVDKLEEKKFIAKTSIIRERSRAIKWLLGDANLYSEVDISI